MPIGQGKKDLEENQGDQKQARNVIVLWKTKLIEGMDNSAQQQPAPFTSTLSFLQLRYPLIIHDLWDV